MDERQAPAIEGDAGPRRAVDVELLGELLGSEPGELTDGEVADGVLALVKLAGQVDAALAGFTAVFEARAVHAGDGARTVGSWVAARSEISAQAATAHVRRGRALRSCPWVADAYGQSVIGTAKVGFLLAARDRVEDLFAEREEELVELIRDLTVAHARLAAAKWRRLALAEAGLEEDAEPCDEGANRLHLSKTSGGRYVLRGDLDAVAGAELAGHVEAEVTAMFASGAFAAGDGLVASQRNARALRAVAARGAGGVTAHGEPRPSVSLVWDVADLLGRPADSCEEALERRCLLADGTPLPRDVAERLLREGTVRDVLAVFGMDGSAQVIGVSRASRRPTARQRRALELQDQGCAFPGCEAPAHWADAHHTVAFEASRITDLDQLALLCRFHHHAVHEGGFTLTRDDHGITVRRPDGTVLPRAGPGRQLHDPPDMRYPSRPRRSRFRRLAELLDQDDRVAEWHGEQTQRTIAAMHALAAAPGTAEDEPSTAGGDETHPRSVGSVDLDLLAARASAVDPGLAAALGLHGLLAPV